MGSLKINEESIPFSERCCHRFYHGIYFPFAKKGELYGFEVSSSGSLFRCMGTIEKQ